MSLIFPNNPSDNQKFEDSFGIIWKYSSSINSWTEYRTSEEISDVSENNDGTVTEEVYAKLKLLQSSIKEIDYGIFKISPGINAYFYYFYSPDNLIEIKNNGDGNISIEVNEDKIFAIFYQFICPGDRGPQGEQGDQGPDGISAGPEAIFFTDRQSGNIVSGQIYTPIPIGTYYKSEMTDISLRFFGTYSKGNVGIISQERYWTTLFSNPLIDDREKEIFSRLVSKIISQDQTTNPSISLSNVLSSGVVLNPSPILEIHINPEDSSHSIVKNGSGASVKSIKFDAEVGLLEYEIEINPSEDLFCKCRQRGPKGYRGGIPDGSLPQKDCDFDEQSGISPDDVLVNLRLGCEEQVIYASYARLESQDSFSFLTTTGSAALAIGSEDISGKYAAVESSNSEHRSVGKLNTEQKELEIDDPEFLVWSPQSGCSSESSQVDFDWIPKTEGEACSEDEILWSGPEGPRNRKYPHDLNISSPSKNTDEECKFDGGSGPGGQGPPTIPPSTGEC